MSAGGAAAAVRATLLAVALASAGCPAEDEPLVFGPPTGAVCPPTSTLTWESFGRGFMTTYCTGCHSSERTGSDRHGAPSFHDCDTVFGVRAISDHIDATAAAGPDAVNVGMPGDDYPEPSLEQRQLLGEWLACGAPSDEFPR